MKLTDITIAGVRACIEDRMNHRPENATTREKIEALGKRRERLRELYLMGEYDKDEYLVLRSDIMCEIQELEQNLSGPDFALEATLAKLDRLGDVLGDGTRTQQKNALGMLFDRIAIGGDGMIREVELRKWARPLFADMLIVNGDNKCPQGNSNHCRQHV